MECALFTTDDPPYKSHLLTARASTANGEHCSDADAPGLVKNGYVDIELFAGSGGMTLGLALAGLSPDHLFELDKHCCETLRYNAEGDESAVTGEIHREDVSRVDWSMIQKPVRLLSGGPPCQPFSMGGKHLAERDGRNQFPATLRAIRKLGPAVVLLENVPGLARDSFRPYLDYIQRQLEFPSVAPLRDELWEDHDGRIRQHQERAAQEPEYHVRRWILNAADYGVAELAVRFSSLTWGGEMND